RNAHGAGFFIVNGQLILGFVTQTVRTHLHQARVLVGKLHKLVTRLAQYLVANTAAILQEEVETGSVTQLHYRRRCKGKYHGIAQRKEEALGALRYCKHVLLGAGTLFPWLKTNKRHGRVLAATGKVKAVNRKHRAYRVAFGFEQVVAHLRYHIIGT